MPGGLKGIEAITSGLHARNIGVLWGYNPWDTGTRREPNWINPPQGQDGRGGLADSTNFVNALKSTGGDGINADTMTFTPEIWKNVSLAAHYPLAFQPEGGGSLQSLDWETFSVCHCQYTALQQSIDHYKWLEPRRCTSVRDRWSKDHTDALQYAFFNAVGFESTESNWGTWNGFTARDAETVRRVFTVLRFLGRETGLALSPHWEPHVDGVVSPGVFASVFPRFNASTGVGDSVWLLVNRANTTYTGPQITIPGDGAASALYDCWRGVPIAPSALRAAVIPQRGGGGALGTTVSVVMPPRGFGCVLRTANASTAGTALGTFLAAMKNFSRVPLEDFSTEWHFLQQTMTPHRRTRPAPSTPPGMVRIPRHDAFPFAVKSVADQGTDAFGADVQYPWEPHPSREHSVTLPIDAFFLDATPVSNAEFEPFLATYTPADKHNFLRQWNGSIRCPPQLANVPVTFVSLNEARRYCEWAGKRLPTEWEWQYAAQGPNGSQPYPWGAQCHGDDKGSPCRPPVVTSQTSPGPPHVHSCSPQGDSPFGVADLVGSVWQYTAEFTDTHSRSATVRGGSNWMAGINGTVGSHWYFPAAPTLDLHGKYMLMSDSYERAGTLGFRCAQDVAPTDAATGTVTAWVGGTHASVSVRWGGPPAASVNLSANAVDWAQWSVSSTTGSLVTNRPAAHTASVIGTPRPLTSLGAGCVDANLTSGATGVMGLSWIGGTPTASGDGVEAAVAAKCGFELPVQLPAAAASQTVAVYGGVSNGARINLTAGVTTNGSTVSLSQVAVPSTQPLTRAGVSTADSVHYITVSGLTAPGELTLRWEALAPPAPAPTPAPPSPGVNYTRLASTACGPGHGGIAIDPDNSTVPSGLTTAQCMARCTADPTCSCVQFVAQSGRCFRRAQCIPSACVRAPAGTDVYAKQWRQSPVNCVNTGGNSCIPAECSTKSAVNVSAARCTEICELDPACNAAEYKPIGGWCWKRVVVDVSKCRPAGTTFELWKRPDRPAGGLGTGSALLYGVSVLNRGAPPLGGYA